MPPPIRVLLNDRALLGPLTGVGHYITQLLLHADHDAADATITPYAYTFIRRGDWRKLLDRASAPVTAPRSTTHRAPALVRRIAQRVYDALLSRKTRRYDLYHEPNHIPARSDAPTVTTIHDLSVVLHPQWHPADRVRWYEREFDRGVRQTRVFLAASEFTKREIVDRLSVAPQRIVVTYQAPRSEFHLRHAEEAVAARRSLELPEQFFLFVGTLEPRKNVDGLLDAFAALPDRLRRRCPLCIVGAWGWKSETLRQKLRDRRIAGDVRLLGYLGDAQLAMLYAACTALVWPTWYEGFGLPPLEAMACGAPVITSNVASLPEVVGDAGMLLDPRTPASWTDAMARLAEDEHERSRMHRAGLAQAASFTWGRLLCETIRAYRAALAPSH